MWTGGFVVAVSGNRDNWMWNMSTHTKRAEYLTWANGEPNNFGGTGEDAITVNIAGMTYNDINPDVTINPWSKNFMYCHICEYN